MLTLKKGLWSSGAPRNLLYSRTTQTKKHNTQCPSLLTTTLRHFNTRPIQGENVDEVCIKCKKPPQSNGCMKIGIEYQGANHDGIVQHSSSAIAYRIEMGICQVFSQPRDVNQSPCWRGGWLSWGGQHHIKYRESDSLTRKSNIWNRAILFCVSVFFFLLHYIKCLTASS